MKPIILVGDSLFAEIAYEYFTYDSDYEVVAFAVERAYLKRETFMGVPVVPHEDLPQHFDPATHSFFAAMVYTHMNRLRTRMYGLTKAMGYAPASYISPKAFIWRNVELGEHVFIFEDNTIQPFCKIGNNVVLWSGNHIGHHSIIRDNTFISSHVVISGACDIGANCFFGVNASVGNDVTVGDDCLVASGSNIVKNVPPDSFVRGDSPAKPVPDVSALQRFGPQEG